MGKINTVLEDAKMSLDDAREWTGRTRPTRTPGMIITHNELDDVPPCQARPLISLSIGGSGYGKIRYDFHGKMPNRWWRFWQYVFLGFVWRGKTLD